MIRPSRRSSVIVRLHPCGRHRRIRRPQRGRVLQHRIALGRGAAEHARRLLEQLRALDKDGGLAARRRIGRRRINTAAVGRRQAAGEQHRSRALGGFRRLRRAERRSRTFYSEEQHETLLKLEPLLGGASVDRRLRQRGAGRDDALVVDGLCAYGL